MLTVLLAAAGAYLIGSISTAVVVGRLMGRGDPREIGSGNPGATNMLRAFGKTAAALTLVGDVLKGLAPVLLVVLALGEPAATAAAGTGAFLGHLYPLYFGFRGGKGVATYIGVVLGLSWALGAAFVALWLITAALTRYSSLAALVAAAASPALGYWQGQPPPVLAALLALVLLLFWRHRENIQRLLAGTESKLGAPR